ncbi:MAG: right-handed parallel beta-helix repeat-containing protein, partial [Nanoarchaeota archaeon]
MAIKKMNLYVEKLAKSRIAIILFITLSFISIILLSLFVYSQQVTEVPSIPSIPNLGEVRYYGYKYANYSNIIISAKEEISCEWKPDNIDDGWKNCEAIFEVENQNNIKPTISVPNFSFIFAKSNNRNLTINFSNTYTLYNETFTNLTEIEGNITENIFLFTKRKFSNFTNLPSSINTAIPFSIRLSYEAPKYEGNSFNLNISAPGFNGFLDPDQTSCGTLSTENAVYTLTQNVSSAGTCFTITANNVTLNGNGSTVTYGTNGTNNFIGVSIDTVNLTTVHSIIIEQGNSSGSSKYGIYINGGDNATIYNNTITTNGSLATGIISSASKFNLIRNNNITINGSSTSGIALGTNNTILNNQINIKGSGDGIAFSFNQNNTIEGNVIITYGGGNGISLTGEDFAHILHNNITIKGAGKGISISSGSDYAVINGNIINITGSGDGMGVVGNVVNITNTTIITTGGGKGIILTGSTNGTLRGINIKTNASNAYGIYTNTSSFS